MLSVAAASACGEALAGSTAAFPECLAWACACQSCTLRHAVLPGVLLAECTEGLLKGGIIPGRVSLHQYGRYTGTGDVEQCKADLLPDAGAAKSWCSGCVVQTSGGSSKSCGEVAMVYAASMCSALA